MREEAYERYVQQFKDTAATQSAARAAGHGPFWRRRALYRGLINSEGPANILDENNTPDDATLDELLSELGPQDDSEQPTKITQEDDDSKRKYPKLYDLAKVEGDAEWIDWLGKHIWTYVGLSAPLLGAPGPLRSVLSGENMGLPFTHEEARGLELCEYIHFSTILSPSSLACSSSYLERIFVDR